MSVSEMLFVDAAMLAIATIVIYFTYNAGVRLAKHPRAVSSRFLAALRIITLGVVIVLVYTVVDIPWSLLAFYIPDLAAIDVLKYIFVYAIISSIVVIPAVNLILKMPFAGRERERSLLQAEHEDLLQQLKIVTSKYLKKEVGEEVFKALVKEIQGKIVGIESKLEKLKIELEREREPKELFKAS